MKVKEILANCVVLQNGSYYLGCIHPNFKDPVVEKVKVLVDNGYLINDIPTVLQNLYNRSMKSIAFAEKF